MKVLILGGSRFIGKAIADKAAADGHEVHLFNRGKSRPESDYPLIRGDLAELESHADAFRALAPEVVVHCMALGPGDAARAIGAFTGIDCQLMVLGSADCYEAFQQLAHGKEASDWPLPESAETSRTPFYYRDSAGPKAQMYDYDKNLLTEALLEAGAEGLIRPTIFRVPMVWGPDDYQFAFRHGGIIRRIYDKQPRLVLGSARQHAIWHYGYVDNIAAAVVAGFGQPLEQGIFNIGEPELRSWRRWIQLYAQAAGFELDVEILPEEWLDAEAQRNAPPQHLLLDTSAYRRLTGFREPVGIETAIERTLAWGLAHPDQLGPAPNYQAEAQALAAYQRALARRAEESGAEERREAK